MISPIGSAESFIFVFMWVEKSYNNTVWIFLLFLLVFFGIRQLYLKNKAEANYFIRFFDFSSYLRIYGNDRDISFVRSFSLGLYLLSIFIYSLFSCILVAFYTESVYSSRVFILALGCILLITLSRYLLARFIGWLFDIQSVMQGILFRTLSYYASLALVVFGICLIFVYGVFDNQNFLFKLGLGLFLIPNLLIQIHTYFWAIKRNPRNTFYLFLYICISKIAPWIWVYKVIHTTLI